MTSDMHVMRTAEMPPSITRFEQLFYASLGIGVVVAALDYDRLVAQSSPVFLALVLFLTSVIMVLFIWLIARRRKNWARWALLVMTLLGLPAYVPALNAMAKSSSVIALLSVTQLAFQGVALYLLFSRASRRWFVDVTLPPKQI